MRFMKTMLMVMALMLMNVGVASAFYKLDQSGMSRLQSRGDGVPYAHALKMILPSEWEYVVEGERDLSLANVSWGDEECWEEAVLATAEQADSEVRFDYKKHKLYVRHIIPDYIPQNTPKEVGVPAETVGEAPLFSGHQSLASKIVTAPVVEAPVVPTWELKPGGLRKQLEDWAAFANYQVAWTAPNDHQISVSAEIEGDFLDAVTVVFESLYRNGSNLRSKVYEGNKVIKVWEE